MNDFNGDALPERIAQQIRRTGDDPLEIERLRIEGLLTRHCQRRDLTRLRIVVGQGGCGAWPLRSLVQKPASPASA